LEFGHTGLTVFGSGIDLIVKTHKKKISKISLLSGTAHLLYCNGFLFLRIWCCKILSLSNILQMPIAQQ